MKLTIKLAPTTIIDSWSCAFCEETFQGGSTLADLFDEAHEHRGVVCPTCLALGPDGVRARWRTRSHLSAEQRTWARADLEMPVATPSPWEKLPEWWRTCFHTRAAPLLPR